MAANLNVTGVSNTVLQPAATGRWSAGLANLLRSELGQWWATRRWWVQALTWLVLINGLVALVGQAAVQQTSAVLPELLEVFFPLSAIATSLGTVVSFQGTIIGERQVGTAAWVLSKPASRASIIIAKLVAAGLSLLTLAVGLQALVFAGQAPLWAGQIPATGPFVLGVAIVGLHLIFYLTLTLLLNVVCASRGPVAGIGVGLIFAGLIAPRLVPSLALVTPWGLPDLAIQVASPCQPTGSWPSLPPPAGASCSSASPCGASGARNSRSLQRGTGPGCR